MGMRVIVFCSLAFSYDVSAIEINIYSQIILIHALHQGIFNNPRSTMANDLQQSNETNANELSQLVVFSLGSEEFGVDIMKVQEIIRLPDITRIPRSPEHIKGVINLRGKIIVVMDLDKRFGLPSNGLTEESRIIVTDIEGTVVGMVVDSVSEVIRLQTANIDAAPEIITQSINAGYLKGVGKLDDRLLILLDLGNIINETAM